MIFSDYSDSSHYIEDLIFSEKGYLSYTQPHMQLFIFGCFIIIVLIYNIQNINSLLAKLGIVKLGSVEERVAISNDIYDIMSIQFLVNQLKRCEKEIIEIEKFFVTSNGK